MTNDNKINEIQKRVVEFDLVEVYKKRKKRLQDLVDKHGFDNVALAAGLTAKSLAQYIRVTTPQSISENTVVQAEKVLEGL